MSVRARRLVALVIAVAAGGAALVYAFLPSPVPVEVAPVVRGPLRVTVSGEGKTRVKDRYVISAPLAGLLRRIELDPGDPVEEGGGLAVIEPVEPPLLDVSARAQAEARVRAAEAAKRGADATLERARAALEFARTEFDRKRTLAAGGYISRSELDAAELLLRTRTREFESSQFDARVAASELEVARAVLLRARGAGAERIEIRSPVRGRVLRVFQESAGVVQAGTPLLEVGDPSSLEIVADLLSTDVVAVRPGDEVLIEQWGGETLEGRVRLVEPSGFTKVSALGVEEQRVNVVVDFAGPAGTRRALGDGYRVEVQIVIWEGTDLVKVPVNALFRVGERWAVFVVQDGRARRRLVEVGQRSAVEAQILSGLEAGERVVLHPSDRVDDGVAVRPVNTREQP